VTIHCTPCQHFTGRGLHDRFKTLWSSWAVTTPSFKYYFAGDTGYRSVNGKETEEELAALPVCPAFKEIGEKFNGFDLASIPIGAYSPRSIMSPVHCNPDDSVSVHVDIKSKKSIGMHYCTFILTDENVLDPPIKLLESLRKRALPDDQFETMKIGESRSF
jgi:N-acyl-phosphatidylethanolamine-hydrolysing phospholipase D